MTLESKDSSSPAIDTIPAIGLLGGTFDPIHNGHLHYGQQVAEHLGLTQIQLMPANIPPLKNKTHSSTSHRIAMLEQVCQHNPLFSVNDIELKRNEPSYTVNTLKLIREQYHGVIYFFIGMDSLVTLNKWFQWQELLNYCHLVVTERPGYHLPPAETELGQWVVQHLTTDKAELTTSAKGSIYQVKTDNLEISSTDIRRRFKLGLTCQYLLPQEVSKYIDQYQLYRG